MKYVDNPSQHPAYRTWYNTVGRRLPSVGAVFENWKKFVEQKMQETWIAQESSAKAAPAAAPKKRARSSSESSSSSSSSTSSSSDDSRRKSKKKKRLKSSKVEKKPQKKSKQKESLHQSAKASVHYTEKQVENTPAPPARSVSYPVPSTSSGAPSSASGAGTFTNDCSSNLDCIEILKLLVQVRGKTGVLADALPLILSRLESAKSRGVKELVALNDDDVMLLKLVKGRLVKASNEGAISYVEKVILLESVNQLDDLLTLIQSFRGNNSSVFNTKVLANITANYSMTQCMTYIKDILKEFNRPCTEDDILPVFVDLVKLRGAL